MNTLSDIRKFAVWFRDSSGEEVSAKEIAPTDLREYRPHKLTVERREPATINRRLTTLRRLCTWAKRERLIEENPCEDGKQGGSNQSDIEGT